jgi:hypothetical protein
MTDDENHPIVNMIAQELCDVVADSAPIFPPSAYRERARKLLDAIREMELDTSLWT